MSDQSEIRGAAGNHHEVEIHHPDGCIEHPQVRFEPTDISFRGVLAVVAAAAIFCTLGASGVMLFFRHEERVVREAHESEVLSARRPRGGLPADPRLEQLDRLAGVRSADVYRRESVAESALASYGETADEGFVHVPIDWAIEKVVSQLPVKVGPKSKTVHDHGLLDAGEPNSGRVFNER